MSYADCFSMTVSMLASLRDAGYLICQGFYVSRKERPHVSGAARWPHEIKMISKSNAVYKESARAIGIDQNCFYLYFFYKIAP